MTEPCSVLAAPAPAARGGGTGSAFLLLAAVGVLAVLGAMLSGEAAAALALLGIPVCLVVVWIGYSVGVVIWQAAAGTSDHCPGTVAGLPGGTKLCRPTTPKDGHRRSTAEVCARSLLRDLPHRTSRLTNCITFSIGESDNLMQFNIAGGSAETYCLH